MEFAAHKIETLDCYEFYLGITNEKDLGYYCADEREDLSIPEEIKPYFNYEAYGYDIQIQDGGWFLKESYVCSNQEMYEEVYNREQHNLPEEYKLTSKLEQSNLQKSHEQDKVNNISR
ncbi:MAG: antirestriction protein ArdA [Lachnospiraceae bacterium]|nr:antirestriction protein ArdA [Lachnospiraceae bacterium]